MTAKTTFKALFALLFLTASWGFSWADQASPISIKGNRQSAECKDAVVLAQSMFESPSSRLYAPLKLPARMRSEMVLGSTQLDISSGDALEVSDDFEKLPYNQRSMYWSRLETAGNRVAVTEDPVGWRGDMYALYFLRADLRPEAFLAVLAAHSNSDPTAPLMYQSWRPPLIFKLPDGRVWVISVGQPYLPLSSWIVYGTSSREPICTIDFGASTNGIVKGTPRELLELSKLLDKTLGSGDDEGTLQPTSRQRTLMGHVLANAVARPWAIADSDAYNARVTVDAGLLTWANQNSSTKLIHRRILAAYPKAQRALRAHYTNNLHMEPAKAKQASAWVLDVVYRTPYVFPGGNVDRAHEDNLNPLGKSMSLSSP